MNALEARAPDMSPFPFSRWSADDGGSVGPGGGGGGVQLSAAEMAKAFQSSVVAHLNELQAGPPLRPSISPFARQRCRPAGGRFYAILTKLTLPIELCCVYVFLQIGFDCALDEFYQCTRNSDEMINTELPEYLKRLACSYDPPQVEAIMTEIKSAKVAPPHHGPHPHAIQQTGSSGWSPHSIPFSPMILDQIRGEYL